MVLLLLCRVSVLITFPAIIVVVFLAFLQPVTTIRLSERNERMKCINERENKIYNPEKDIGFLVSSLLVFSRRTF